MRCKACNKNLSDAESTRKSVVTGDYLDLCDHCLETIEDDVFYTQGEGGLHGSEGEEGEAEDEEFYFGGRYAPD